MSVPQRISFRRLNAVILELQLPRNQILHHQDYQYRQKEDRLKKFGEHAGMKSVRPEEVEGGQSSGIIF